MDFYSMLKSFENNGSSQQQTKVANAEEKESAAKRELSASLEKVAGEPTTDAAEALMKTAATLAENEKTAEMVHAEMLGRAFAEGALNVFAAVDAASQKVAAEQPRITEQQVQEIYKAAAEQGYRDVLEKVAEYEKGYGSAVNDAVTLLSNEFIKGAQEVDALINLVQNRR